MNTPLPAYVSKVTTLQDGSLRLVVDTREMPPEQMTELFALKGREGWMFLKEQPINIEDTVVDLPEVHVERYEKTPSQRLRAVLFLVHKQEKIQMPFDQYYNAKMNEFIDKEKEKLNPL